MVLIFLNYLWWSRLPYIMQIWGWVLFCFSHTLGKLVFDCSSSDRFSSYSLIHVNIWAVKTLMHPCWGSCSLPSGCPGHLTFCLGFWCEIWTNLCVLQFFNILIGILQYLQERRIGKQWSKFIPHVWPLDASDFPFSGSRYFNIILWMLALVDQSQSLQV